MKWSTSTYRAGTGSWRLEVTPDETLLRECGDRIDQLLDTLEGSSSPTT